MRKYSDPALVVGFSISTILAVATAVLPTGNTSTLLSLIVGTLGAGITLQIDTILRVERRYALEDARSDLVSAVQRAPHLLPDVTRIMQLSAEVFESKFPDAFNEAASQTLATCRDDLAEIAAGRLRTADGDMTPLVDQVASIKSNLKATTIAHTDRTWWLSPSGSEYIAANKAAVDRGLNVERIVIVNSASGENGGEIVELNKAAGVRTMVVDQSVTPREALRNLAIYDDAYLIEDLIDARGQVYAFRHSLQQADLASALGAFAQLKTMCREA